MSPRSPAQAIGHEFDAFLFATIGTDRMGLQTTVISMLGRRNLDPWQAAADFAGRPAEAAAQKLASMISEAPDGSVEPTDAQATAVRLISLLPRRKIAAPQWTAALPRVAVTTSSRTRSRIILAVVLVFLILGAQFLLAI
jgi:hypothetical protein